MHKLPPFKFGPRLFHQVLSVRNRTDIQPKIQEEVFVVNVLWKVWINASRYFGKLSNMSAKFGFRSRKEPDSAPLDYHGQSTFQTGTENEKFRGGCGVDSWRGAPPSAQNDSNETVGKPPKHRFRRRATPAKRGIGPGCVP